MKSGQSLAHQLFEAVEEQNLRDVIKLIDTHEADPNFIIPEKGVSSFHLVVGCECPFFAEEATRVFLQHSGNPNIRNDDGLTPVHVAAVWGRSAVLMLLLSCGGDPWLRDYDRGFTPLHFALKEGHWEAALILQRHQLMDRHKSFRDVNVAPRFNLNLHGVVVLAGEMQAEYSSSPQSNGTPDSLKGSTKVGENALNIKPLESNEYVQQWCHKEFSPLLATSTPTHHKTLNYPTLGHQGVSMANISSSSNSCKSPNITSTKGMTPKVPTSNPNLCRPKESCVVNVPKAPSDARKKLFLELKKRFNGLKQSLDLSKEDSSKGNIFDRNYFGRKSSAKIGRNQQSQPKVTSELSCDDNANETISFKSSRSIVSERGLQDIPQNVEVSNVASLENSPVDEVDAVPVIVSSDTSVEWIASHSCFSDDLSPGSSNSQSYFTCDEEPSLDSNKVLRMPNTQRDLLPNEGSPDEAPKRPPRRKQLKGMSHSDAKPILCNAPSVTSFGTIISEEYYYTDNEAGVVLIEKNFLTNPVDVPSPSDTESVISVPHTVVSEAGTSTSDVSSVPASFCYDTVALRRELEALGEEVGPITQTTKKVYLRRLYRLKKNNCFSLPSVSAPVYPPELQRVLSGSDWEVDILTYAEIETTMSAPFSNADPSRRWREGIFKSSFNYLLLDPRVSLNLPANVTKHDLKTWQKFISSVFYIGKGKRSRPYAHLYQAVHSWRKPNEQRSPSPKIQRILDIWREGQGVVCLHVFQNIIPVEAFTREAAMMDAIGMNNLVNVKKGEYYGPAATWKTRQKRQLGTYLLYRAMCIFLCEGERQLRPGDIDK